MTVLSGLVAFDQIKLRRIDDYRALRGFLQETYRRPGQRQRRVSRCTGRLEDNSTLARDGCSRRGERDRQPDATAGDRGRLCRLLHQKGRNMIRGLLLRITWKLQSLIAPTLKYSQAIYEETLIAHCGASDAWLDLGCGHHLLPTWRLEQEKEMIGNAKLFVGIDYDYLSLNMHRTLDHKVRGDMGKLPFPNAAFDLLTSNMVFEHLDKPETQLKEIARVLKPGGKLIIHTPNTLGYVTLIARMIPNAIKAALILHLEGRKEEDVFPAYYRANSAARIAELASSCGLRVSKVRMICSSPKLAILPPLVLLELLWIRLLMTGALRPFRTNIVAILENSQMHSDGVE